jgi:hypothetical protein
MLKKFVSMTTAAIFLAAGLSIITSVPASATVYASNAGAATGQTQLSVTPDNNGNVTVPQGVDSLTVNFNYSIATPSNFASKRITYLLTVTDPTNTVMTDAAAQAAGNYLGKNGFYYTSNNGISSQIPSNGVTLGSTLTYLRFSISGYLNAGPGGTIPAGNYNFQVVLNVDGVAYTPVSNELSLAATMFLDGRSYTNPTGNITAVSHNVVTCINRSLVTSSDTLTVREVKTGNLTSVTNRFLTVLMNGSSSLGTGSTLSLGSVNLSVPFAAVTNFTFGSTTAGDSFTTDLSITKGDGTEVSGSCSPAAPSTPTLVFTTSTRLTATFNLSSRDNYGQCELFLASDLNNKLRSSYTGPPGSGTSTSCVFSGLTEGVSYAVKAREMTNFYYYDNLNNSYFNVNREFYSPLSAASSALSSAGSSPAPSTPTLTPEQIAAAAAAAAVAAQAAAAAVRAAEIATAQTALSTVLKADKAGTLSEYRSANINITTNAGLTRLNAEVLKLAGADRTDFAKIKALADKIEFDESFFNATARPSLSTYSTYGVTGVTERILPTVNSKILELPAALRVDVKAMQDLVKVENFVDRVANTETRSTVSASALVEKGLLSSTSPYKYSVVQGLAKYPEGSLNTMAKIEAAIKEQIAKAEAPKLRLAAIKAKIAARKK